MKQMFQALFDRIERPFSGKIIGIQAGAPASAGEDRP